VESACSYNGIIHTPESPVVVDIFAALPVCLRESESLALLAKEVVGWLGILISEGIASYKIQEQYSKESS
jgi:hypothetical protein